MFGRSCFGFSSFSLERMVSCECDTTVYESTGPSFFFFPGLDSEILMGVDRFAESPKDP